MNRQGKVKGAEPQEAPAPEENGPIRAVFFMPKKKTPKSKKG
jgi:hypothetical protein